MDQLVLVPVPNHELRQGVLADFALEFGEVVGNHEGILFAG